MAGDALDHSRLHQAPQLVAYRRAVEAMRFAQLDLLGDEVAGAIVAGEDGLGEEVGDAGACGGSGHGLDRTVEAGALSLAYV